MLLYVSMTAEHCVAFIDFSKVTKDQLQVQYLLPADEHQRKTFGILNTLITNSR